MISVVVQILHAMLIYQYPSLRNMVKKEPVSLTRQTIIALIPYLSLYAFYRIQKLRMYILISIVIFFTGVSIFVGITLGMMSFVRTPEEGISIYENNMEFWKYPPLSYASYIAGLLINIYLVRRWSKKWNEQFVQPTNSE